MDSLTQDLSRCIVLATRPTGLPSARNFRLEKRPVSQFGTNQVLCRNIFLSMDPFIRTRLNEGPSYAVPVQIGEVVPGLTISRVVLSKSTAFQTGDIVVGMGGWQDYSTVEAEELRHVDVGSLSPSTALGVLGMPGLTAYVGLLKMGSPKPGETVVVSAAAGAVGSVVGQIAKIKNCRAVGIAGSSEKCRFVRDLGFDECIDYSRTEKLGKELAKHCPSGVDVYFDNVGGSTFGSVTPLLNLHSRIVLCGMIANLNANKVENVQDLRPLFVKRTQLRPILVSDHVSQHDEYVEQARKWIHDDRLRYRENIVEGLENAAVAFTEALIGRNLGKHIVQIDSFA